MPKTITIEVPEWIDEKSEVLLKEKINDILHDLIVDVAWEKSLEKSRISDEEIEKISENIKERAWQKVEKMLGL